MKMKTKKYLNNLNVHRLKSLKSIFYKIIFSLCVILFVLFLKKINIDSTKVVLNKMKYNIEYEMDFKSSGIKIYENIKNFAKGSKDKIPVFNINSNQKYIAPINGEIYKDYEKDINSGVDLKSIDEKDPKAIIDGKVKDVYLQEKQGYFVTIQQDNIEVVYGYLSKSYVSKGEVIDIDTPIGSLGMGKDENKYLRIEFKIDGQYKNPSDYIDLK